MGCVVQTHPCRGSTRHDYSWSFIRNVQTWQVNWFEVYYAPHAIEVQFLPKRAKHARTLHVGGPAEVIAIQDWNLPPIGEVTVRTTSTTTTHDGMTITTTEYPPFVVKAGDTIDDRLRRLAEGPLSRHMDAYLAQLPHARVLADFRRFRTQPWSQRHDKKALAFHHQACQLSTVPHLW